ncbi:sensor histidine kinase [Actinophytocola sp. KF-1]
MTTSRTGLPWLSGAVYGLVLLAGLYYPLAGLGDGDPVRLIGFVAGMAALTALDVVERRVDRAPAGFLVARLALFFAVAALDESGLSRALFVLVPFTAYLVFGRPAGLALAAVCLGLLVAGHVVWVPDWYRDATYLSDLLMFGMGLVLALAMADVTTRERRAAARIAELSAATERNRVARDIHDSLGHHLTAITIQLAKASAFGERDPAVAAQALADASTSAQRALRDVRTSVGALRAAPVPLRSALADLAGQDDRVTVRVTGDERDLDPAAATALHRAAQEAVTNARRHSEATEVSVTITYDRAATRLVVADNGRGFDPAARTGGFGLSGLRERAALVGGTCAVESSPGRGTRVTFSVPARGAVPA